MADIIIDMTVDEDFVMFPPDDEEQILTPEQVKEIQDELVARVVNTPMSQALLAAANSRK
jgi:hypothetical protein